MKNIQLKDTDKQYLFSDRGAESVIYLYGDNKEVLLKYFRDEDENKAQVKRDMIDGEIPRKTLIISKEDLKIKEKKVHIIPNKKSLEDEVQVLDAIYNGKDFKGYTMKREHLKYMDVLPGSLKEHFTIRKRKIAYLKLIRDKIEKLNADGIFIGDFNEKNFLTDKDVSIVKLCDLDNLKINDLSWDTEHKFVQTYKKSDANIDYVDSYAFNLFTLAFLNKIDLGWFNLYDVKSLPKELNTKENEEILESLKNLNSSYQPKYLIDNLR